MADYSGVIDQAAQRFDVDPKLISAVIQTESGGNPDAVSSAGAIGLGQIMPATAKSLGIDPTDPIQNINGTAQILSQNLTKFGNVPDALKAYNGGWDPSKWSNSQTAAYVPKVTQAYAQLSQQQDQGGQQTAANGASDVPLTSAPAPQSNDAFSQMFGAVMPKDAPAAASSNPQDAFMQAFGPVLAAAQSPQGKSGFWSNVGTGLEHSLSGSGAVGSALNSAVAFGDKVIPGAQALDNLIGRTPQVNQQAVAGSQAGQQQFQQGAGQTLGGQIGNAVGNIALTAPIAETGAGLVGSALGAAADALPAASLGNKLLTAGQTLATGSGAAGLGNKLVAAASSGALKGAIASTAAGAGPGQGAAYGAALGPVGMAAAPLARGMMLLGQKAGSAMLDGLAPTGASDAGADASSAAGAPSGAASGAAVPPAAPQAIPTSLPKTGLNLTQKGADATADKIIAHFAQGGPTTINDNALLTASDGSTTKPSLAQVTGNPGIATLERAVQSQSPQAFAQQWAGNDAVRNQVISVLTGQPGDIEAAENARDALTSQARNAAFADAKPVDAQPVVDQVQQLIAQNAGRPTVQGPLQQVLNQLVQKVPDPTVNPATGLPTPGATIEQPISDPATLYNVRKYIGDIVSPKVAGTAQDGRAAAAQLLTLKPVLDDTIESGAPGYQAYISQFDQLSQPIDGMRALQALNLTDANGNTTLAKLDNAVKSLTKQQNAPGYKMADSITPEQMQQLMLLRDNMRQAGQSSLGRTLGSNTFQNFATNNLINAAGSHAGHAVGAVASAMGADATFGPLGMAAAPLGYAASHLVGKLGENSREMVMQSLTNKLLNPQAASNALKMAAKRTAP
jgi:soluble lytic murein transglycosylase-like protein